MKIFLRNYFLFLVLMLASGALFAQPTLNYSPTTIPVTVGTSVGTISPNTTGTVGIYAALTNWAATVSTTGTQSAGLAYDAVSVGLYGTEFSYGQLDKISLAAAVTGLNNSVSYFPVNSNYSIAVDASGTVYATNSATNSVEEFTVGSYTVPLITITGFTTIAGIAIDASNNLYVVDANGTTDGAGKVYKFAPGATTFASGTAILTGLNNPFGIAFSGNDIYLTAYGSTRPNQGIVEVANGLTGSTTVTKFVKETTINSVPFKTPHNLTFDGNGNLFVADFGNNTIERITPDATPVLTKPFTTNMTTPNQIAFDANGNLYLGDLSDYYKRALGTYYTITSGVLPTGLKFNPVTGVITGTPTANSGTNPVVITATNAGATSTPASLTFSFPVPPTVSYAATTPTPPYTGANTFYQGVAAPNTIIPTSTNVKATGGFGIVPTLPAGLSFNLTTGAITGTPTGTSPSTNYVVTVTGPTNLTGTTNFNLSVVLPATPVLSYSPASYTLATGASTSTINIINGGGPVSAYTFTPTSGNLPAGITFSNTTGAFTCTPTAAGTVTGTVSGSNAGGGPSVANITITVADPPALSYTPSPYTAAQNIAFTFLPTITGGSPTSYALASGTLPTGIFLNPTTGAFYGTSTALFLARTFTVTATNAANLSTTVTAIVRCAASQPFTYAGPYTYIANNGPIAVINPSPTSITGATISPALPTGLIISTAGVISGSPTAVSPITVYTVTATTANGSINYGQVSIAVNAPAAPIVSYSPSSYTFTVGTGGTTSPIGSTGGLATYSIDPLSPALPAYLTFNSTTGVFTCSTSAVVTPAVNYIVDATNITATVSTTVSITITNPPPPALTFNPNYYSLDIGSMVNFTVITSGGAVVGNYSISPTTLPPGLSFNASTGTISGTTTAAYAATVYTVSASNTGGTGSATVTIAVNILPPAINYTPNSYNFTVNAAIPSTIIPNSTGGAVASGYAYTTPGTVILNSGATTGLLSQPVAVAVDPTGNVYVANYGTNNVVEYSTTGTITPFATNTGPLGIVFDSSGNAYVLTGTTLSKYTGGSLQPTTFTGLTAGSKGLAIDASNNLYVSNSTAGTVTKFPITGGTGTIVVNAVASGFAVSTGVAVDGTGNIYVGDGTKVDIYNSAGIYQSSIATTKTVYQINIDGADNIMVADNTSVVVYNQAQTAIVTINPPFTSARGIAADAAGNLYVSDFTANTVTQFVPKSGYFLSGGPLAAGLSFSNSTGQFSGTPTAAFAATTYTVTGYNADGGNSTTITLSCVQAALPVISYSPNYYVLGQNVAMPSIAPNSNAGGVVQSVWGYGNPTTILTATVGNGSLSNPWGMGVDPTGNIYVVNNGNATVTEYSTTGTITTFSTLANPIGIAFDSSGNAYVLTASSITKYTGGVAQPVTFTGVTGGVGIAIDASNNIFVASTTGNGNVKEYAITGSGPTGTIVTGTGGRPITYGVAVDGSGNIYVGDAKKVDEYTSAGVYIASDVTPVGTVYGVNTDDANDNLIADNAQSYIFGTLATGAGLIFQTFSSARGTVADAKGNLYIADYTANTVYEFPRISGYSLSGPPLPPGVLFDNATGQFSGTPTTVFPATTYTVTGYNSTGSGSTTITFLCLPPNNWVSTGSTDWTLGTNWSTGTKPASTETAYIGTTAGANYTVLPIIPVGTTITVGSLIMGTLDAGTTPIASGIVVNGILNATNTITLQSDANAYTQRTNFSTMLSGTGTITTGNVTVSNNTNSNSFRTFTEILSSSVASLNINGTITLNSLTYTNTGNGNNYNFNSTFNITAGTVLVNNVISTNNLPPSIFTHTSAATSTLQILPASTATLKLANAAALSSFSGTGTNVISFNNPGATVEYSGAAQTVYTDLGLPGLTTGPSYYSLTFSGSGIKSPNGTTSNNLNIAGDFNNTLTNDANNYVLLTGTVVNFNGTMQSINVGPGATAASPLPGINGTVFNNVVFSGAGTKNINSGVFHVSSTGLLNMSGTLATTILNVASTANLCLNSDIYGSANVAAMTGPSITGSVDVQRYLSGGSAGFRGYRSLSSPVNTGGYTTIDYLLKSCYVTATTGATKGFDGGVNPTLYLYRENLPVSNATFISGNFRGINDRTASPSYTLDIDGGGYHIPVGNGYLFFFRGDRNVASFSAETTLSYVPTATILTATGSLNQGNIVYNNWYNGSNLLYTTVSGPNAVEGFNFVGNPYASSIDWDKSTSNSGTGIVTTNVKPFIYIFDALSKNYNVYKAGGNGVGNIAIANSNIIASGQGFFVQATTTGATLMFKETGKSTTQVSNASRNLFMGVPPLATTIPTLHLVVTADSVIMDGTIITFDNNSQTQYLPQIDAPHKPGSGLLTMAARSTDSIPLAYYTLPFPKQSQVIPLNVFATANGTYQLNMATIQYIPQVYDVWLKDEHLKDSLDIKHNPNYSFDVSLADTSTFGPNRFKLIIRQNPALMVHLLNFTASKITGGDQVVWTTENEQNYTNFTVQRSTDGGKTFNILDGVTSSAQSTYSYLDSAPVKGANSYRLVMTDLNGAVTYSNVVTIMYANTNNQIATNGMLVYPNPTVGVVNLAITSNQAVTTGVSGSLQASYNIEIVNNLGSVVKTATSTSANWQTDVSALLPGTYFIQVTDTNQHKVVGKTAFVRL